MDRLDIRSVFDVIPYFNYALETSAEFLIVAARPFMSKTSLEGP